MVLVQLVRKLLGNGVDRRNTIMALQKRVIPVIQIDGGSGKQVKTRQFKEPRYIGNPINTAKIFFDMGVHEVAIINISGTLNEKTFELLDKMTRQLFIPVSYGGGIKSLEDAREVFTRAGVEKIIINSAISEDLIGDLADELGSQSVVVSIDHGKFGECYLNHGRDLTQYEAVNMAKDSIRWGAGEILMNSVERDGTMEGYDIGLLREIVENVNVPVVALGGAGSREDIKKALETGCGGAAAGSIFCYKDAKKRQVCVNYVDERIK
jgi:imidazole glycerol-phosphate synthase subunit HisF